MMPDAIPCMLPGAVVIVMMSRKRQKRANRIFLMEYVCNFYNLNIVVSR